MNEYYAYVDALERGEDGGAVKTGGDGSDALFEHIMLRLRTSDGMDLENVAARFGTHVVDEIHDAIAPFVPDFATYRLAEDGTRVGVRLTDPEGFLVSTEVLATLIWKMPSLADVDEE
jgi:oxygen-independent coproporphyrinogen-3 oxidase